MARLPFPLLLAGTLLLLPAASSPAQTPPKHEFRGAWIATVLNLDWPNARTATVAEQKETLKRTLDRLKAAGVNAVFFQVRAESDAFYASDREPWSYWLTGEQGRAPDPAFDPLRVAVRAAHERGMELHAWFNPFRAARAGSDYEQAAGHVSTEHPAWVLAFSDGLELLDPGRPEVRSYVTRVVMDVVRRYEIDGVHFDDYFYPYPPNEMDQPGNRTKDQATFEANPRGFEDVERWRRDNVTRFIRQVHDSVEAAKPKIAVGVSPFGIWKDGVPSGISGLSAYHTVYADAVAWLEAGTVDYLAPQLYWGFGGGQDYATLAPWWAEQARARDRHLYPGLAAYKSPLAKRRARVKRRKERAVSVRAAAAYGAKDYASGVVPRQVRFNRRRSDVQGSVLFRTEHVSGGLADSLRRRLYATPALPPPLPDRTPTTPAPPQDLTVDRSGDRGERVVLRWTAPPGRASAATRYAVYRVRANAPPDFTDAPTDADHLLAVTGRTKLTDRPVQAPAPYHYAVTTINTNSTESAPRASVAVEGRATPDVDGFALRGSVPNPFTDGTAIRLALPTAATVTVTIYDVLGRTVRRRRASRPAGGNRVLRIEGRGLAPGLYLYRVTAELRNGDRKSATGRMMRVE
jgi:uncharacterized lipoprotein YddW (UPF0748 family)